MLARERLYLTADRKALVAEGDKRGAFLYAAPGDEIPKAAAEQFGLEDGGLAKKTAAPKAAPKAAAKPATKEIAPDKDK